LLQQQTQQQPQHHELQEQQQQQVSAGSLIFLQHIHAGTNNAALQQQLLLEPILYTAAERFLQELQRQLTTAGQTAHHDGGVTPAAAHRIRLLVQAAMDQLVLQVGDVLTHGPSSAQQSVSYGGGQQAASSTDGDMVLCQNPTIQQLALCAGGVGSSHSDEDVSVPTAISKLDCVPQQQPCCRHDAGESQLKCSRCIISLLAVTAGNEINVLPAAGAMHRHSSASAADAEAEAGTQAMDFAGCLKQHSQADKLWSDLHVDALLLIDEAVRRALRAKAGPVMAWLGLMSESAKVSVLASGGRWAHPLA
jgi:hypothetical protein